MGAFRDQKAFCATIDDMSDATLQRWLLRAMSASSLDEVFAA